MLYFDLLIYLSVPGLRTVRRMIPSVYLEHSERASEHEHTTAFNISNSFSCVHGILGVLGPGSPSFVWDLSFVAIERRM